MGPIKEGQEMKVLVRGRMAKAAVVLAAVAALGVSATAATAAPKAHKLTTITLGVPGIPPVFLGVMPYTALEQGYYKKYGVDVQIKGFTSGTDAVKAVQAGQIDLAWSPTPFAMTLISKGVPLVGIEGMDHVDWVLGSNSSSISACADLKGQNIGVDSIGGARYQALQAMLTKCGLDIKDVHPVVFPGATAVQAMLAGQLHASVLHLDDLAEAASQGTPIKKVVTIAQTDPYQHYDMLVTLRSTIDAKRAALINYLKADIQAIRYMNNPKALGRVAQIGMVVGHNQAVTTTALKEYLALNWWPLNRSGLGIGTIKRTVFENVRLGNISAGNPPTWSQLTDTSLWKAAYKAVTPVKKKKK
jgi:NitT/TauT family transport system substrate-binding protein